MPSIEQKNNPADQQDEYYDLFFGISFAGKIAEDQQPTITEVPISEAEEPAVQTKAFNPFFDDLTG